VQLTPANHYGGGAVMWRHMRLLQCVIARNGTVDGILPDQFLHIKYSNPDHVYETVWGIMDFLRALLHFYNRLGREGRRSPFKIQVIVFFANGPQNPMFGNFRMANGGIHPSGLMHTAPWPSRVGLDVPLDFNPAHMEVVPLMV
jgi:hypothetical protein